MKKSTILIIVVLIIWNLVLTYFVFYPKSTSTTITEENVYGFSTDLTKVAEACSSSAVVVESTSGKQSGFVYKQDNGTAYIVTTFHGIGSDKSISVRFVNGKTYSANVVGFDFKSDIAVLSLETPFNLNVVKCGDNEYLKEGEFIINIGTGDSDKNINNIKLGVVSNNILNIEDKVRYQKEEYKLNKEMIYLSLSVNEGYSGSPLFNMNNEVVGMVEMSDQSGCIYASTINEIKIVSDLIISAKEINKLDLGISGEYIKSLKDFERNMYNLPLDVLTGYYVNTVDQTKLASSFGLISGDIIVSINNKTIVNQKDLLNVLYSNEANDVTLSIIRNGETIELKGTIND